MNIQDLYAQMQEYMDMDIEEILALDISTITTSKKEEKISQAPGIISVLTAEDIKELGAQDVSEAIGFMTGVLHYETYLNDFNSFAIRGNVPAEHYNSKTLFLINGHPSYMSHLSGFEVDSIPIDAIERIEVIRGPVSVLYGTNALTGVINVITKKKIKGAKAQVHYQHGSFGTDEGRFSFGDKISKINVFASMTLRNQTGYHQLVAADQNEAGVDYNHKMYQDLQALFISLEHKGLEFDFSRWKGPGPLKIGVAPNSTWYSSDYEMREIYYGDLRYKQILDVSFADKLEMHYNLRFDKSHQYATNPGLWFISNVIYSEGNAPNSQSNAITGGERYGAETYANIDINEKLNLITGIVYENSQNAEYYTENAIIKTNTGLSPWLGYRKNFNYAAYANFDYKVLEKMFLVGGMRYSVDHITKEHIDYRMGSIYKLDKDLTFKILYGTAYRSPSFLELFTQAPPILNGSESLRPEVLEGVDVGVYYTKEEKLTSSLVWFWNRSKDFIARQTISGTPTYVNLKGRVTYGLEAELKAQPFVDMPFTLFANGSYILDDKDLGTGEGLILAKELYNVGWSYQFNDKLQLTNANHICSAFGDASEYFISNFALFYRPGTFKEYVDIEWNITLNNAFNTRYNYAEPVRQNVGTMPGGPLRSVSGGVTVKF